MKNLFPSFCAFIIFSKRERNETNDNEPRACIGQNRTKAKPMESKEVLNERGTRLGACLFVVGGSKGRGKCYRASSLENELVG